MNKHRLLEDIAQDAQNDPQFFEEVIEHTGLKPRNLMQMYMIYKFKWNWEYDTWNDTCTKWVDSGMAGAYDFLYNEEATASTMYRRLVKWEREK